MIAVGFSSVFPSSATALGKNQLAQLKPPDPHPGRAQEGILGKLPPPDETDAAKTDNCFSVFSDLHFGQGTCSSGEPTNSSNFAPQSAHLYSKIGILLLSLFLKRHDRTGHDSHGRRDPWAAHDLSGGAERCVDV